MLSNTSIDELINKRLAKIISKSAKRVMSPKSTTNIATSTINSNSNSNQNIDSINANTFDGVDNLEYLWLSSNQIKVLNNI